MTVLEMKVEALMKCVDQDKFEKAMAEITDADNCNTLDVYHAVRAHLVTLGTPAHIKGYRYLAHAVELTVKDESLADAITLRLYPQVAKEFNTTPSRVERAIRHAVEVTWDRGDLDIFMEYFGHTVSSTKGKPTNGEFIARLANVVRDQIM